MVGLVGVDLGQAKKRNRRMQRKGMSTKKVWTTVIPRT